MPYIPHQSRPVPGLPSVTTARPPLTSQAIPPDLPQLPEDDSLELPFEPELPAAERPRSTPTLGRPRRRERARTGIGSVSIRKHGFDPGKIAENLFGHSDKLDKDV